MDIALPPPSPSNSPKEQEKTKKAKKAKKDEKDKKDQEEEQKRKRKEALQNKMKGFRNARSRNGVGQDAQTRAKDACHRMNITDPAQQAELLRIAQNVSKVLRTV